MSFSEVLEALPGLSFEERQLLIRRVIELDDTPLSVSEEHLIESRLAAHHLDPTSSSLRNTEGTSQIANEVIPPTAVGGYVHLLLHSHHVCQEIPSTSVDGFFNCRLFQA